MFSSTRIQSDECNRAPARVGVAGDYSPRAHRNPSLEKPCTTVSVGTYHQGSEADFLRLLFWPHKLFQTVRIKQRWWLINDPHSEKVDALLGRCRNYL